MKVEVDADSSYRSLDSPVEGLEGVPEVEVLQEGGLKNFEKVYYTVGER